MTVQAENLRRLFPLVGSIVFVIVYLIPAATFAQTGSCKVTLDALPAAEELKGFRLGMTKEQVRDRVPQVVFGRTDELGISKTTVNPGYDPRGDRSGFQDVRSISLDFLDDRLISLWIGYDQNFKWITVDEFVKGISKSLTLPNAWSQWKLRGKAMTCADFQLTVSMIAASPSFRILDNRAEEVLAARRAEQEEQQAAAAEVESKSLEISGDRKTRTYYPPGCPASGEIAETNRISFKTVEEAIRAGYKQAPSCS